MKTIEERRAYNNSHYAKQSPDYKAQKVIRQRERIRKIREAIQAHKAKSGCMDCGEKDPIVLDLDHRDRSQKSFTIGNLSHTGMSLEKLMQEVDKCDVVCANCHRRRTARQMNWLIAESGTVAQLVEHRTENPGVAGSTPAGTTINNNNMPT